MTNLSKLFSSSVSHPVLRITWHQLISRLDRHPSLDPTTALPRRENHGEWLIRPLWEEQPKSQMAEEPIPSRNSHLLLSPLLGQLERA
jgi:hypothetical protein